MINRAETLEKKIDKAEERGDITVGKADKFRDTAWDTMAEIIQQDADQDRHPGRKIGRREALPEYDEATEKIAEKVKPSTHREPKRKPIDKHADDFRAWMIGVTDELESRSCAFFDAARFAANEASTTAEIRETAAEARRVSKAFERRAERIEKINKKGGQRLRSV
jgi:hypothetical protein